MVMRIHYFSASLYVLVTEESRQDKNYKKLRSRYNELALGQKKVSLTNFLHDVCVSFRKHFRDASNKRHSYAIKKGGRWI
jgi:hypothetical protein